jgi:hypothetical protein
MRRAGELKEMRGEERAKRGKCDFVGQQAGIT